MSGYLKSIDVTEQFDGDTVTARLRPLSLAALLHVRTAAAKGGEEAMMVAFQSVVPDHVESLSGLRAADGTELGVADLCASAYFLPLLSALGSRLLTDASPKNAQPPSAP